MRFDSSFNEEQEMAVQNNPFPEGALCQHCLRVLDGPNCEHEIIEVGLPDESYPVGLAHWLCCHACRDENEGEDCETFISVPRAGSDRGSIG